MTSAPTPAPVDAPDAELSEAAQARLSTLEHGPESLGSLAGFAVWAARVRGVCPPPPFSAVRVVAIASDVMGAASSERAQAVLNGETALALLAGVAGAELTVVDVGLTTDVPGTLSRRVRAGSGSVDREDALTEAEVLAAIQLGRALADEAVDAGADLLVPAAISAGAELPAVITTAVLSGREPIFALGFDPTVPDAEWSRRCTVVRDALRRTHTLSRDAIQIVQTVGSIDLAVLMGLLLQAAGRRTPVLLDGLVTAAAALLAIEISPAAQDWWFVPQHAPVATERVAWDLLSSTAAVSTELRLGEGCGALAVLPLLQNALRVFAAPGSGGARDEPVAGDG